MSGARTFWLPPDLGLPCPAAETALHGSAAEVAAVDAEWLGGLCRAMRERKRQLAALPVRRIIEALHKTSEVWLDRVRRPGLAVVGLIARATGTSPRMVEASIRLEMESSLGPDMEAALWSELGSPDCLDGLTPNPWLGGRTRAVGPALVGGIVSANIPALPHLTVMRSLLVKSPCVVKSSRSEPFFLPEYAQTLYEVDPQVGRNVAVVLFSREDDVLLDAFLREVSFLIAYGGLDAMSALRPRLPEGTRALLHGHRLGFALVSGETLRQGTAGLAEALAWDVVLFDQEACLAPHVVFVEGGFEEAVRLAEGTLARMRGLAPEYPPPALPLARRLAVRQEIDALRLEDPADCRVLGGEEPGQGVAVVQRLVRFAPSPLGRFVRFAPVERLEEAVALVGGLGDLLQNAAVAAPEPRFTRLAEQLAEVGVARVCRPGNMGTPTMMWHHDGLPCLAAMVRFTDVEEGEGQRPGQRPGLPALDRVMQEAGTHLDRAAAVAATAAKRLWFRTWGKRKQDL